MRMLMIGLAVSNFLILSGCSSPNWEASIQPPAAFQSDQPLPLIVEINENGKPVTGLKVHAELEMTKMDHGTTEVDFKETDKGKYEGTVRLPMGGEWNAYLEMTNGNNTTEQTVTFEVE